MSTQMSKEQNTLASSKATVGSVSMMVLAKLDNSLLQQQSTSSMAKTNGFAKKPKNNKILTQYLADKNIEDIDHRR